MKKTYLKSFCARCLTLLVLALLSTNLAWGGVTKVSANQLESGEKYIIVATYNNDDYLLKPATFSAKSSNTAEKFNAKTVTDAATWIFTQSDETWTIKLSTGEGLYFTSDNNGVACAKDKGASFTIAATADGATTSYLTASDGANTRYLALYQGSNWRCYKNTDNGVPAIQLYKVTDTPAATLVSVAISGTPNKTTYKEGEEFDPTGLVVTGTYDEGDPEVITSGIAWNVTPSPLTVETTSVSVTAMVGDITSPEYVFNGLTVTEKPALPSYTLVTDASTLMDGDVIVLGAVKEDNWYVNGSHTGTNKYLDSKDATYEDDILESEEAVEITLEETTGGWYLKLGNEYINTTAAKALTFANEASTVWTIGIDENKLATVAAGDYGRFLYNASSPRFLNYTSDLNASMLLPQIFKKETAPASADVTISSVGWATVCLPFKATITSGNATAYYVTTSGSALNKVEANVIPAGEGVLLKSNEGGVATVTFTESAVAADNVADKGGNYMKGSVAGETFDESGYKYYILANDETKGLGFYFKVEGGASVECAAGKAVLAVPNSASPAKEGFPFDEESTGISESMVNGQSTAVYNLNGMQVDKNYNGIVIMNGKKYINK